MLQILVIENESYTQSIIVETLRKECFKTILAEDGIEALSILKHNPVDLMILDDTEPTLDGYSVCRQAREISGLPIIMLISKQEEGAKLRGYELGADECMTKPFNPDVLLAKVRVLLKRASRFEDTISSINISRILLNPASREVFVGDEPIELTYTEYELLLNFMRNPKRVFSRDQLLNRIWGYEYEGMSRTVDVHVRNLRRKLGKERHHIVTLVRSGYKFETVAD